MTLSTAPISQRGDPGSVRRPRVLGCGYPNGVDNRICAEAVGADNQEQMAMTLLIVDDHSTFRSVARKVLEHHGYVVVGEAADGETAIEEVRRLKPDIVLLDVQLPGIDGFEVAARLTANGDTPAIVVTSSRDGEDFGPLVERSGALGFVPKADLSGAAIDALVT